MYACCASYITGMTLTHLDSPQIHARLGELLYIASSDRDASALLKRSVQHFSRSIELCDDYLRGFYGLILVQSPLFFLQV